MANTIVRIEKWLPGVVDTVFAQESKTALLENGGKYVDLDFKEAGYVKIMSLLMDGLSDYYRVNHIGISGSGAYAHDNSLNGTGTRDGYHRGNVDASWEVFKLSYDRGKQFLIDNMDNEETAGQIIANLLTEFLRTKVVPEIDAVRFSKIASKCNATLGNLKSDAISANTIISNFNQAFEWLFEHEVPEEEQVIFVSPAVMTLIRNTTELNKFITQEDFRSERGIDFTLPAYMGRPIIAVPSDRFYTDIVVGENGYYPSSTAKVINYLICSKKAIVPVVKLNKSKVWTPETQDDFDGYKVNVRLYHDVIIPKNKIVGCFASVSTTTASTKAQRVDLALSEGSVSNAYKVDGVYSTPAGILGTLVSSASAFTLGSSVTIDESTVKTVELEGDNVDATNDKLYFALVSGGKAVAISSQITLPKKA